MQLLSKINIADLQTAIDRAEANGPLRSLSGSKNVSVKINVKVSSR